MKFAIVGAAKFKKGSKIIFDEVIFQSSGYLSNHKFKYNKHFLAIQDFSLNFFELKDQNKYLRYEKILDIITHNDEKINIILHKTIYNNIFHFKEYSKLNVYQNINHRDVIIDMIKFFSFRKLFSFYSFSELILITGLFLRFNKTVNSNLRPSNGFYNIMKMFLKLDSKSVLHCFGFSRPDLQVYINNFNFKSRPHQKFDLLVFNKLIKSNKIIFNEID